MPEPREVHHAFQSHGGRSNHKGYASKMFRVQRRDRRLDSLLPTTSRSKILTHLRARGGARQGSRTQQSRMQTAANRKQFKAGSEYRKEVFEQGAFFCGFDPGRKYGPDPRDRQVRLSKGLSLQHIRHVLDSTRHISSYLRPSANNTRTCPYVRLDQALVESSLRSPAEAWARGHRERNCP